MKRFTEEEILKILGEPNGADKLMNMNADPDDLYLKAVSLYKSGGLASALLLRLANKKPYLIKLSEDEEFLSAVSANLAGDNAKLRRNSARLAGALRRESFVPELTRALGSETQRLVRPSMILALGSIGGEEAKAFLSAYSVAPAADETEEKHFKEETDALTSALRSFAPSEEHAFTGFSEPVTVELRAPDRLTRPLADELGELGLACFDGRSDSLKIKTADYPALFEARCFTEALFPIGQSDCVPSAIAKKAAPFLFSLMRSSHSGKPPFRFRVELKAAVKDPARRQSLVRDIAAACESDELVNAPSDYEAELRVEGDERGVRLFVKLFTVPDERFSYRKESIPASINPAVAASVIRFAQDRFRVGARVIDPCCGSGTMLIERAKLSPCQSLTGVDIAHRAIDAARTNTAIAGVNAKYIVNDILRFECHRPYDELIANLPFGNRVGNHSSCEKLYRGLVEKLPGLVRKGGTAVLYTMEFTLLKNIIKENPRVTLLKQERTEAGGLMPMIFILEVN
ncbi:MAG: methyltransferase [Clostridia bacterium]|nr:methyltransferase [Clostridia bacterium]